FKAFCFSLFLGTALQKSVSAEQKRTEKRTLAGNSVQIHRYAGKKGVSNGKHQRKQEGRQNHFLPLHGLSWTRRKHQTDTAVHHLGSPGRSNPGKSKEGRRAGGGRLGAGDTGRISKGEGTGTGVHPPAREAAGQLHGLCQ